MDSVYSVYSTRIHNEMPDHELFDLLSEMTYLLKDGHVNLYRPNNIIQYGKISGHPIGFIYISSFSGEPENFEVIDEIIEKFSALKGIIIDVRLNGGGNSNNADTIASRFADKEYLFMKSRYRNGPGHTDFTPWRDRCLKPCSGNTFIKPVAVLSNRRCFSSTEWFLAEMDAILETAIDLIENSDLPD
ncbi:MAG: hypothetical protein JW723_04200 [Bacteroidales bacterium]|nr:hypothetical protein [Bacteroidales bacterium]